MTSIDPLEPKQARSLHTRTQLLQAIETLLRRSTFDELTVSQITTEANVAVGTFYKRFASKEALLQQLLDAYWAQNDTLRAQCLLTMSQQSELAARLRTMVAYYIDDYSQNAGVLRNIVLRWRLQFATIGGREEHQQTIQSVHEMANALLGKDQDIDLPDAIMCVHLVANQCRDFCLFPELLADPTSPKWRTRLASDLLRACLGLLSQPISSRPCDAPLNSC